MKALNQEKFSNVLLIDSNEERFNEIKEILSPSYIVLSAPDVATALDSAIGKEAFVPVIILSIQPSDKDPFSGLKQIKSNDNLNHVPVILMCGESEQDFAIQGLDKGAIDFITAPFNPSLIKSRLKNAIRLHKTCSALEYLEHDELTGLLTREAFLQKATEFIKRDSEKKILHTRHRY